MDQTVKIKQPKNPREGANIFSIITFAYMIPTFIKGYFCDVVEDDIPRILQSHSASDLGNKLEAAWNNEAKKSLWNAIMRVFGIEFGILGVVSAIDELFLKLIRPLALAQLLKYYSLNKNTENGYDEALICAGVIFGASLISNLISHQVAFILQVLGMKIRVACCSLIYRKTMVLSKSALANCSGGQVANMLSNDVGRIDSAVFSAHSIWQVPIQIVIIVFTMYEALGLDSTVGVLLMILLIPIQVHLGKKISQLRLKTALYTDERVRIMNEIIHGIKVIKMYTWEKPFEKIVLAKRRLELGEIQSSNYIRGFMKCAVYSPKFAMYFTVITTLLTGNNLTAIYVFTVTCFYDTLKNSLCVFFTKAIADVAEVYISINRIQNFLLSETYTQPDRTKHKPKIQLKKVTASWSSDSSQTTPTLKDVTLEVNSTEHVAIIGPTGSGKTSVLELLLNELTTTNGTLRVTGKIAYAPQEPWLFSGNIQQNILFGKPMNKTRYQKVIQTCALEQDLQLLPYADLTLVGERGVVLSGGQKARVNLARAVYSDSDIYLLDDPFAAVDARVGIHIFNNCIRSFLKGKYVVVVTHQLQYLQHFHKICLVENGLLSGNQTFSDILHHNPAFLGEEDDVELSSTTIAEIKENGEPDLVPSRNLCAYIKSGGSFCVFASVMACILVSQLAITAGEYFVAYWINQQEKLVPNQQEVYSFLYVYSGIVLVMAVSLFLQAAAFFKYCTITAKNLHAKMFSGIINTSLSFFYTTPSGGIVNRFSKDIGVIDEQIPMIAIETIQICSRLIITMCIICYTNPWAIIHSVLLLLAFYSVRKVYNATNRRVRIFEANARSPVFGHLNESIQGISTIRAFDAQDILRKEFDAHQNYHTSVWYLQLSSTRCFIFIIDTLCSVYIGSIIFTLTMIETDEPIGNYGLAITQAMLLLASQQWGILMSTELENNLVSVQRVVEYSNLKPEDSQTLTEPSASWPEHGKISFNAVHLKYSNKEPNVLHNLNFTIKPNEKIGVVGRTGAGKSSLVASLFQLFRTEGTITIDGVDISEMPLKSLRSKISIIPQEPVLFSGTLRKNLDPFDNYSDDELWKTLEDVELKSVGLDYLVLESGSNLSVGQRQLICLARAILRKNRVLVLDEATANVDLYTDALIQRTLRLKFEKCTAITVAHRLDTVMDSDKVLVMQDGRLVQFGHPFTLLQDRSGVFYSMLEQTGEANQKLFTKLAEDSFNQRYGIRTKQ